MKPCSSCGGDGPKFDLTSDWCAACTEAVLRMQHADEHAVVKHEVIAT